MLNPLIVVDPALIAQESNHHSWLCRETLDTCREMGISCTVFASARTGQGTDSEIVPLFETDTYQWFAGSDDYRHGESGLRAALARDFAKLDLAPHSRVLLHSANPWQLEALARVVAPLSDLRLAVGLMFPARFWTPDSALQRSFDDITWQALDAMAHLKPFVYSETGVASRAETQLELPTCVPMMSARTRQVCQRLVDQAAHCDDAVRFGFFGGLFEHKGVGLVLDAARRAEELRRAFRIVFSAPDEFRGHRARLGVMPSNVIFDDAPRENHAYLKALSEVTAVLCCYDPQFYAAQMSGIVTEAASVGRPVIVTRDTALHRFLLRFAPGCAVPVDPVPESLLDVMSRPASYWREKQLEAAACAPVVQELKSYHRFLRIALGY